MNPLLMTILILAPILTIEALAFIVKGLLLRRRWKAFQQWERLMQDEMDSQFAGEIPPTAILAYEIAETEKGEQVNG